MTVPVFMLRNGAHVSCSHILCDALGGCLINKC